MVISPSALPATGISGSRNTAASLSTLSSLGWPIAATGASPTISAPEPNRPSARRRVLTPSTTEDIRSGSRGLVMADLRTASRLNHLRLKQGQGARQHIERHHDNDT